MVERTFRLQGLPDLRHLQGERARGNFATASADLNQTDQKLKAAHSQLDNMTATSGSNLAVAAATRNAARIRIQEGIARKGYAEAVVEQRQRGWEGAKRLAATLEKLENRYNEAVSADNLHRERIILNEIASRRDGAPNATDGTKTKLRHKEIEIVRRHQ